MPWKRWASILSLRSCNYCGGYCAASHLHLLGRALAPAVSAELTCRVRAATRGRGRPFAGLDAHGCCRNRRRGRRRGKPPVNVHRLVKSAVDVSACGSSASRPHVDTAPSPPSQPASEGNAEPCQLIEYFEVPELRAAHILPASSLRRACRLRRAQSNEKDCLRYRATDERCGDGSEKGRAGHWSEVGAGMTNQPAKSPTQKATFHTASTATAPATVAAIICCLHCTAVSSPRRFGSLVRLIAAECHKLLRADTSTGIVEGM
jgi:hypothetical protein